MKKFNYSRLFIYILFISFIFRIFISQYGYNIDLIINAAWGEWIWRNGPSGFYTNNVWVYAWPTQLPLINLIYSFNFIIFGKILWLITGIGNFLGSHNFLPNLFSNWFNFVKWFGWTFYKPTPFNYGFLFSMKLIPILSDIITALIIFLISSKIANKKYGLIISTFYLMLPTSWYVSTLWGQYDGVAALLLLISFLALFIAGNNKKKYGYILFPLSSIFYLLAMEIKPTAMFFGIIYIYYFFHQRPNFFKIVTSGVLTILLFFGLSYPFSSGNILTFNLNRIFPVVFNSDRYGLVNHAFNFWQFLMPFGGWSTTFKILWVPALYWGFFSIIVFSMMGVLIMKKQGTLINLFTALYIVAGGVFMFATGMVDRYYYFGYLLLTFLTLLNKKLFEIWILSSLLYAGNLFYSWGFPFLSSDIAWKSEFIIRTFSLFNVLVFLYSLKIIYFGKVLDGELINR